MRCQSFIAIGRLRRKSRMADRTAVTPNSGATALRRNFLIFRDLSMSAGAIAHCAASMRGGLGPQEGRDQQARRPDMRERPADGLRRRMDIGQNCAVESSAQLLERAMD